MFPINLVIDVVHVPGILHNFLTKEVVNISQKISYRAMIGSKRLDSFFSKESKEEEE
tara:strand:- start:523 stop:693 length:171 start_codon:yes stop_codon:yes gene_type:complete